VMGFMGGSDVEVCGQNLSKLYDYHISKITSSFTFTFGRFWPLSLSQRFHFHFETSLQ
jgi:hypothetical protein